MRLSRYSVCGLLSSVLLQDLGDDLFLMRGQPQTEVNKYRPYPRYEAGKHMPFDGCEDWNTVKLTRQGEGVPEFGPEDESKREKLVSRSCCAAVLTCCVADELFCQAFCSSCSKPKAAIS